MRRFLLPGLIGIATIGAFVVVALQTGSGAIHAATGPNWGLLLASFAISTAVQPLRALAWSTTLREPVPFRAVYASSAIGSFLDTVLPGRLGEASKVGVLRVAAGSRWPGFSRAAGSLLCAHLIEAIAFSVVGAASAFFLPFPGWARGTLTGGLAAAAAGMTLAAALHHRIGRRLPRALDKFLAGAAAPPAVLARTGGVLLVTWIARWGGILLLLHAVGVPASAG